MKKLRVSGKPLTNKRYLWSFFAVVLIVDIIITALLFSFYSSAQISKAREYSLAQLKQACTITDLLFEAMDAASNQILQDTTTSSSLRNVNVDRLREAQACIKLRDIQSAHPYMRYVSLYNSETKRFLSSSYAGVLPEDEIEFYYEKLGNKTRACIFRNVGANYYAQSYKQATAYTFIYKITVRPGGSPDLILIDVDEAYFSTIFNSLRALNDEQEIVLLDSDYNIITVQVAEKNQKRFTQMFGNTDFSPGVFADVDSAEGALSYNSPNLPNRFLTYAKAEYSGFTVVNTVPYASVLSGLSQIALLTLALWGITLGFGYILSKKMSRTLYAPIQKLYDSYVKKTSSQKNGDELEQLSEAFSQMYSKADRLEQGLISTYTDSRKLYLDYLLKGRFQDIKQPGAVYERLGIDISAPFYTVILIQCLALEDNSDRTDADIFLSHYALENITREVTSKYGKNEMLRTGENSFAVLLSLPRESLPEDIVETLKTVSVVMHREFMVETTICIGRTVNSFQDINMCYESTKISLNAIPYKDHGSTFIAGVSSELITAGQYYNKLHSKLADFVRAEDLSSCQEEFDLALSSMNNISFQVAKTYFNHVMMSILDEFSATFDHADSSFGAFVTSLDEIIAAPNVRSMKKSMMDALSLLMHKVALSKKSGNQDAADIAKSYIDKNFINPDLSSRMLADLVGLSPAYFGKIFTAATTFSFNDYLNNTRMKKAAEQLTDTDLPIAQISEAVGILNTNYFYSVFKKRYGMTPSAYRQENKNQG